MRHLRNGVAVARNVLAGRIMPYATSEEMTVRIVKAPSPASIRKAQGYTD